jgi:hypothetical protein
MDTVNVGNYKALLIHFATNMWERAERRNSREERLETPNRHTRKFQPRRVVMRGSHSRLVLVVARRLALTAKRPGSKIGTDKCNDHSTRKHLVE